MRGSRPVSQPWCTISGSWPKGLSADAGHVRIEFLPKQPGPDFGRELPHQLIFPFVEGFYRFKWGMSFTERVSFDFSGRVAPAELLAEADDPLVPVLPPAWYARTAALGRLAVPLGRQFALWDRHVANCFRDYLRARDADRCYGYFNYGDWYGERGRNWGNNEYDFAHGYFMQFARTGNRDYFRASLTAARHQADVDCVHAYPDPYYVGGNHEHSIGHTGMLDRRAALRHLDLALRRRHLGRQRPHLERGHGRGLVPHRRRPRDGNGPGPGRAHHVGHGAQLQGPGHARALGRLVAQGHLRPVSGHVRPAVSGRRPADRRGGPGRAEVRRRRRLAAPAAGRSFRRAGRGPRQRHLPHRHPLAGAGRVSPGDARSGRAPPHWPPGPTGCCAVGTRRPRVGPTRPWSAASRSSRRGRART